MINQIKIPYFEDHKGLLEFISHGDDWLPFDFKRIYFIKNVPKGEIRGAHGHKHLEQVFIAISGSFQINVESALDNSTVVMSDSKFGLYVSKNSWRQLSNFSSDAICLVLASEKYDAQDYYFDKEEFFAEIRGHAFE